LKGFFLGREYLLTQGHLGFVSYAQVLKQSVQLLQPWSKGVWLLLELVADLGVAIVIQNARVVGPWRLLLRFQRKVCEARQCVAGLP
jgi:hypothetical protein